MESLGAIVNDLLTTRQSLLLALCSSDKIDYQAHVGASLEQFYDRIKTVIVRTTNGRTNKYLVGGQLRQCVLTLRQLLITRFELLCNSIQLENHVRYAFTELCSLLDLSRDKINEIIEETYGSRDEMIGCTELLDILLTHRRRILVNKLSNQLSVINQIVRQESYLIRTVCAALLTLLPPPSWGNNVTSYILREGLDSVDNSDWTNFLMPGINCQVFRDCVAMATTRFWKAVSQDIVAMDHVSNEGVSSRDIHDISKELEAFTTLSCSLLYTGVQLERHRANRDQDYVTCRISTLMLTDKSLQYGCHGSTLTGYTIINDLLKPCCSILGAWLESLSHTHFTSCLQANAIQVKIHFLRGVANLLQDCSQWYHCQLHRYISNWQLEQFLLLLMGDVPLILTFIQQQLLPLVNSQLVGVANQLQVFTDDVRREHDRLTIQCALVREHLSNFLICFHDNLVKRYQQLWKQPIKLADDCTPTDTTKEAVEFILLPCVKACAALPPTTQGTCVTLCVTIAINCWRNCLLSNNQRYSKQHFCQLLSDYTYMVSSSHDPNISTTININHLPVVTETREALYKLCGIYYHSEHGRSHDPASHDPIVIEIINKIVPKGTPTDQWAVTMAAKKKHK